MEKAKRIISGLIIGIVGYVIFALLVHIGALNEYFVQLMMIIGINIILAVSLNLVLGFTGQFTLGHAGFMSVGGYTAAVLTLIFNVPFLLALLIGGAMASLFGLVIGIPTLRLKGDYLAVTTLGFGEIIRVMIVNIDYLGGARGFPGIPKMTTFLWVYVFAIVSVIIISNIIKSTHGRAMISIREDEIAAESIGINTTKYKVHAFVIAAFFAGLAGGLYAHYFRYLDPGSFNFSRSFEMVTYVVAGGMGSLSGSVIAAILLTLLPEGLRFLGLQQYRMFIFSILLLLLMLFRPQGLLGNKEVSFNIFNKISLKKKFGGNK